MMEIIRDFRNKLLKRREIQFKFDSETNPGFVKSKTLLVEKLKVPESNVVVKFVKGNFGSHDFLIEAFVYDSEKDKARLETVKVKKAKGDGK